MASKHGFDAVNLDMGYLAQNGPEAVRSVLEEHGLKPGAFRFPIKLTDEATDKAFERALLGFEKEAVQAAAAGFTSSATQLAPWSITNVAFGEHFRLAQSRLKKVAPILRDTGIRVGLEFIGTYGLRRTQRHDFVHTVEGVRCLAAAANIESHVGLKLDSYHWWATGELLEDVVKLQPHEVVYVELSDAWGGFSRAAAPELSRDLPGTHGIIDASGMLAALKHIGYTGPIVAEPFNRPLQDLTPERAVATVSTALDLCVSMAVRRRLPEELIGTHAYYPEVVPPLSMKPVFPEGAGEDHKES